MLAWIHGNFATLVVCMLLILVIVLVISGLIRDKKRGKTCASCGGCSGCAKYSSPADR